MTISHDEILRNSSNENGSQMKRIELNVEPICTLDCSRFEGIAFLTFL